MLKGKIIFEKLVRDRILQKLENDGFTVHYKVLSHDQKKKALQMKLIEEIDELLKAQSKGEVLEELCDLYDVLEAIFDQYDLQNLLYIEESFSTETIQKLHLNLLEVAKIVQSTGEIPHNILGILPAISQVFNINNQELHEARTHKHEKVGEFKNGIFIKYIEFDKNSNYDSIMYFKSQPEKYQLVQ